MRNIAFPILGLVTVCLVMYVMPLFYEVLLPTKNMCAEGCSGSFKLFLRGFLLSSLLLGGLTGFLYAKNKISNKLAVAILFIYLIFYIAIIWYSTGYGYGLNYSY